MKLHYIPRSAGGYWVSAGEKSENLPMIKVEPITGTRKVGQVSCWKASHKKHQVIRDTRKEAATALYAHLEQERNA